MLVEIVGWAGSLGVLAAYALLSAGRLSARSLTYQLMNIGGALGMAINGWVHSALPSVFNNLIWMGIGLFALVRLALGLRKRVVAPAPVDPA
jgi:hypothetical protein